MYDDDVKKSWQVFARDVGRLARVRKAWIIVIGVLITPALYAWFNISAFWDPYSNTENVSVAVANLDEGATSDLTGAVNIGDQVEEQLRGNDDLGWDFMTHEEALEAVQRGDAYAAIVIPAGFSEDLLSITTSDFAQPALQYYVNEKSSAIAPKITDVGATELDRQITSAFAEEVASAASEAVRDAGDDAQQRLLNAQDRALNTFDSTSQRLASVRESIDDLQQGIDSSRESLSSTRRTLGDIDATLGDVQQAIDETQGIIAEARTQVIDFTDAATAAYLQGTTLLTDASSSANTSVTQLTQSLDAAGVRVEAAIEDLQGVLESNEAAIAELRTVLDDADLDPDTVERLSGVIEALEERNAADQQLLSELSQLSSSVAETVQALQAAADAMDGAMQDTKSAAVDLRVALTENLPALNSAMSQLSESAGEFSAAVGSQRRVLAQAGELLLGVDTQLASTSVALGSFDDDIANIESSVQTARTDVEALVAASELGALSTLTGLDPDDIAQFIASPVEVDEQILFPVSSYGSAMAALFTNLSLWIGSFVLMVIFKIEVDTEGVEGVSVLEAYLGRFGLFAMLAVAQALIVSIGNLIIGVQTASAVAFVGTAVLIGLAYVSIIYALCVAFGHVGRGLCILLVIMQIPGASGLYPIEMMPDFFRAIYPLLPFSYGIDAMRETIAGFYGNHYWRFMGALAVFVALAFLLGLVLRRRLANLHILFNKEIASTDLLIGEKVQVTGTGYRLSQVIHALSNRREYRDELARRARPFTRHYPTLLRLTLVVGLAGILLLAVVAWLFPEAKALLLGLWSLWCLLVIGFLVAIEYAKRNFAQAYAVAALEDAELREVVLAGDAAGLSEDSAQTSAQTTRIDVPAQTLEIDEIDEGDAPAGPDEEADLLDEIFTLGEPAERDEPDPDAETTELDVVDEQDETDPADDGEERA